MKFTLFKCTVHWFLVLIYSQDFTTICMISLQNIFIIPKKKKKPKPLYPIVFTLYSTLTLELGNR